MVWKLLGAIALALALLLGAFFAWIHVAAERRWAELKARIPALLAEARGRDPRRPTLGEAVPGNAWDEYRAAFRELGYFELKDVIAFLRDGADEERARDALGIGGGVLEPLERGTRKAEGAHPWDGHPDVQAARMTALLAVVQARFVIRRGNTEFARDRLWQAAQLSADLGRDARTETYAISMSLLDLVFHEMKTLPPDPTLARGLALLDGAWPDVGDALRNEALSALLTLARGSFVSAGHRDLTPWNAWRYGFSKRLMEAVAVESAIDVLRSAADNTSRLGELEASKNPVLQEILFRLHDVVHPSLRQRARLRLLRRHHGETAELEDPFGGTLKSWSVGPNGVDDGGAKDDVVLEVLRK